MDPRIVQSLIKNKGQGFVALTDIPTGTIILREKPAFVLSINDNIVSDIFEMLYQVFTCGNQKKINHFISMSPKIHDEFIHYQDKISQELKKLKIQSNHIYQFFKKKFNDDDILLFCAKYMSNAFEYGDSIAILFNGRIFNHSCLPNIVFYRCNDEMCFITVRDICKGEELLDSYVNITRDKKNRQSRLWNQYRFHCNCQRCLYNSKQLDNKAKNIYKVKIKLSEN
ncbi:SET domain-containing protein [Megavirus baoshan]|uniref:SET domain-containing protein n=1 Tax=Megavirus baoshan TaxID=2496520 RepID=A0A3S8UY49_9VIRU|nr:SET domain-containing protein [Megavirus baoshan]AZL89740.1 SET domain-containing protein [Megavirus baoshan]